MAGMMDLEFSQPEHLLPPTNSSENDEASAQNPVCEMARLERENMQILQMVKRGFTDSRKDTKKLVARIRVILKKSATDDTRINHEIQFILNENQSHELEILRCLRSLSKSSAADHTDYRKTDEFLATVTETIEKFKSSIPGLENDAAEYAGKIEEIENKILEYGFRINQMKHVGDYWSQVIRMLNESLKSFALKFQLKTGIEVESDNDSCQLFADCIEQFLRFVDNFKGASVEKSELKKIFDDSQIELAKLKANIDPESSDLKSLKYLSEKWYRELVSVSLQGYDKIPKISSRDAYVYLPTLFNFIESKLNDERGVKKFVAESKLSNMVDIEENFDHKMRTLSEGLDKVNSKLKKSEHDNQNLATEITKNRNKKNLRDVDQGSSRLLYLSSTTVNTKSENDTYKTLRCKMLAELAVLGSDTTETHIIIDQLKQRLNRSNKQLELLDDESPILLSKKVSERRQYEEYYRLAHERIEMLISRRESLKVQNEKLNNFPNFEEMKRAVVDLLEKVEEKNRNLRNLKKSYNITCKLNINVDQV